MGKYIFILIIFFSLKTFLNSNFGKGFISERVLELKLKLDSRLQKNGKVITNVYVPKENDETTEIDALYITPKGLIVLENKNYSGYIFGSEENLKWTVTLPAGRKIEKHQFYNPIRQNNTHIKYLRAYINEEIKVFSVVTFSNRGELKNITVKSSDIYVINHVHLYGILGKIRKNNPDLLTDSEIEAIYSKILQLTKVSRKTKQKHVNDIKTKFDSTDICPLCGGALILRTSGNNDNGTEKHFYGCSNYPKCRYKKSV